MRERSTSSTWLSTPRITLNHVGAHSVVTHIRNEDNDLKAIVWQFDSGSLTRRGSLVLGAPSVGAISACGVSREIAVAAIEDKNKNLKLVAYGFPEDGAFIEQRGTATAESIREVEVCRLGTQMVVTGVRSSGDKLRLFLWRVTDTGDDIVRVDGKTTDESFSGSHPRMAMCQTGRDQFVTTLRDANGNLKLVSWKVAASFQGPNLGHVEALMKADDAPEMLVGPRAAEFKARGGDCDDLIDPQPPLCIRRAINKMQAMAETIACTFLD